MDLAAIAALEDEAVSLVKRYGFYLPAAAKNFMRKLANVLGWEKLRGEL